MKRLLLPLIAVSLTLSCAKKEPSIDIWTAAAAGNTAVIKDHITFGTDVDATEPAGGSSPLIIASLFGQTEVVRLLLDNGANVDLQNNEASTALHTAAFFCHVDTVEALLKNDANTQLTNSYGRTPLESVSSDWSPEIEGFYTAFGQALQIPVDLERIKTTRPKVAELIRTYNE